MKLLRLANVLDISTGEVLDGVTVEIPESEDLPSNVEEAHALIDRLAVGCETVIAKHHPTKSDFIVGLRHPAVEKAVKKVRALIAHKSKASREIVNRHRMVDCVKSK